MCRFVVLYNIFLFVCLGFCVFLSLSKFYHCLVAFSVSLLDLLLW